MNLTSTAQNNTSNGKAGSRPKYAVRRTQILDAAASVFAEIGYTRASTGDIAARLGMRQSNLYYYIRSKDEALAEICLLALEDYVHNITEILNTALPFADKLHAVVRAHLDILSVRADHYVTFLTCRHDLPDAARREVGSISRQYETLVERLITEGIITNEIAPQTDPCFATSCLLALCHNPILYRKAFLGRTVDQASEEIANLFLNGLARTK